MFSYIYIIFPFSGLTTKGIIGHNYITILIVLAKAFVEKGIDF